MSRGGKLLIAGLVLVIGFGLAWPFRKRAAEKTLSSAAAAPQVDSTQSAAGAIQRPAIRQPLAKPQSPSNAMAPGGQRSGDRGLGRPQQFRSPPPHVAAKMASMADALAPSTTTRPAASFDLANHPALAGLESRPAASPVTPPTPPKHQVPLQGYLPAQLKEHLSDSRPAYSTADRHHRLDAQEQHPSELRHVVQNSDTLEKLAKRYLGDEGRALEIFDLNRDVLDNPHLLPIDAQLRIPARAPVRASRAD